MEETPIRFAKTKAQILWGKSVTLMAELTLMIKECEAANDVADSYPLALIRGAFVNAEQTAQNLQDASKELWD